MLGVCDALILLTALSAATVAASPPVFVWTSRDLGIKTPSLGDTLNSVDFRSRVASKIFEAMPGTNVALFVQPRLSFADLVPHAHDDVLSNLRRFLTPEYHAVTIDRVIDPLAPFQTPVDDRVRVFEVSSAVDAGEKLKHSNPHFVNVFKFVLPDSTPDSADETLRSNDKMMGEVMKQFQRVNHPFVGIFTGEPSEDEPSVHVISKRAVAAGAVDLNNLWDSSCIKAYFKTITVRVFMDKNEKGSIPLTSKPTVTSACDVQPNSITAVYTEPDGNVTISLSVKKYGNPVRGWELSAVEVQTNVKFNSVPFETNDTLKSTVDAWASPGFSFHCSTPKMLEGKEDDQSAHARLQVTEMQIQGLMKTKAGETKPFGESFDCVGFFSMPIFIGLLTTLLLIFFTTFAVVAMANIRTPERYDDPKGPKISVPNE